MSQHRKSAFAALVAAYHNSFAEAKGGVVEHSPEFISKVIESSDADLAAAALRLDPRLTSTESGAVAVAIAKAISENEKLSQHFIDIELSEPMLIVHFEEKADQDAVKKALAEVGTVAVMAAPGDQIADGVQADMLIVAVEPAAEVTEAVVGQMKARMVKEAEKPAPAAPAAAGASKYDGMAECKALGLEPGIYGDEALATCGVTAEQATALFVEAFGKTGLDAARKGVISDDKGVVVSEAPADEAGVRARLLRILAVRGFLTTESDAAAADRNPLRAIGVEYVGALVAEGEDAKWSAVGGARVALTAEAFQSAVDDVAVEIDSRCDSEDDIYDHLVERVLHTGLSALTAERKGAVVEAAKGKGKTADEAKAVAAKALRRIASATLLAAGAVREAALAEALNAWAAFKPASSASTDPMVAALGELIGA